jgi:hypothetical protein
MAVACVLLGISGGIRFWREWQFQALAKGSAACPFPLDDLPRSLGSWRSNPGSDGQLDPEVAQLAGSSKNIIRDYVDEKTGERVTVLVLYGLATRVYGHLPEICYPAAGYRLVGEQVLHEIAIPDSTSPLRYRSAIYMKKFGGIGRYEEACHTFLHHGQWQPNTANRWKLFRYYPGLFKIQLSRTVSELSGDSPTESLLRELAREISSRIGQHQMHAANKLISAQGTPVQDEGRPRSG